MDTPRQYCNKNFINFIYTIDITVHILPIMSSYLAIASSLLVLQRYLCAVRLHTHSIQTPSSQKYSLVQPDLLLAMQHQCYPGVAIEVKDSHKSHSQLIKPCVNFPCMSIATVENEKDCI